MQRFQECDGRVIDCLRSTPYYDKKNKKRRSTPYLDYLVFHEI